MCGYSQGYIFQIMSIILKELPAKNKAFVLIRSFCNFIIIVTLFFLFSCGGKEEKIPPGETTLRMDISPTVWNRTTISGSVKLPEVEDHSGILVYAVGKSLMVYSSKDGNFSILDVPLGTYQFEAVKDGFVKASLGTVTLEGNPQNPAQPVTLPQMVMEKAPAEATEVGVGGLVGRVELEGSEQVDGVLVQIPGTLFKTVTDAEGVYRFFNLPPKVYTLNFSKADYQPQTTIINVPEGEPIQSGITRLNSVRQPQKIRKIYGSLEVYDLKGNQINKFDGVLIALVGTNWVATPDESGRFTFENLPPGKYIINALSPNYQIRQKVEIDLSEFEFMNVGVVMDEVLSDVSKRGVISGTVHLAEMDNHSGATIALAGVSFMALSDASGKFAISNVPPGTYTVLAQAEGYVPEIREGVEVKQGEETKLEDINLKLRVFPPEVIYTEPADGEENVLIRKKTALYIRFSKQMKPPSLKSAFSIRPSVDFKLFAGRESRFSDFDLFYVELSGVGEKNLLSFETRYTVTISTAATDYENIPMEKDYTFTFTTGKASITGTNPEQGERDALINLQHPIHIFFNAAIDASTLTNDSLSFSPDAESTPQIRFVNDPETGWTVARIYVQLTQGERYTVRLGRGIRTESGSYISNTPYSLQFRMAESRDVIELQPR